MKVTHLTGPKAGTSEHLKPARAQALIDAGFAQAVPFPKRGGPGWLEAMAEVESQRVPSPSDTIFTFVQGTTFEVISLPRSGKAAVIRRSGFEVTRFESLEAFDERGNKYNTLPSDCPASIRQHFAELIDATNPDQVAAINERALQERLKAETHERTRTAKMMGRLGLVTAK